MKKIYLFAAIFALVAGVATFFFSKSLSKASVSDGVETANVVIALQDIEPDTVVTPSMFETATLPVSAVTYGTLVNPNDVDGYVAAEKINKGEQVLASKLIRIGSKTNLRETSGEYRLSYHLENGYYAYTIPVEDVNAVAYFVRVGDYINVYQSGYAAEPQNDIVEAESESEAEIETAAVPDSPSGEGEPLLRNVKVLEIGTYSDHKLISDGSPVDAYTLLTLRLTEKQISKMMENGSGSYHVALVPYTEGAGIEETTAADGEDTAAGDRKDEDDPGGFDAPETNYAMGEITSPADAETAEKK